MRQDTIYLTPGGDAGVSIHVSDLATLLDFLSSLSYRFPEKLGGELEAEGRGYYLSMAG